MNAPKVDVRAVLRDAIRYEKKSGGSEEWIAELSAVRAAVAELVEECERLCAAADGMLKNADGMSKRSPVAQSMRISAKNILRLRPALARIGGQS